MFAKHCDLLWVLRTRFCTCDIISYQIQTLSAYNLICCVFFFCERLASTLALMHGKAEGHSVRVPRNPTYFLSMKSMGSTMWKHHDNTVFWTLICYSLQFLTEPWYIKIWNQTVPWYISKYHSIAIWYVNHCTITGLFCMILTE